MLHSKSKIRTTFSLFIIILLSITIFTLSWSQENIVSKKHIKFYKSGQTIEISDVLDLASKQKGTIITCSLWYNMTLSNLEADWLYDGKVIGHTTLTKGLKKWIHFDYDQPISGKVSIRLTGPAGQIQTKEVRAKINEGGVDVKDEEQHKHQQLAQMIKISKNTNQKDASLANQVKYNIIQTIMAKNLLDDESIALNISNNNQITIYISGSQVTLTGQLESRQDNENIKKDLETAAKKVNGVGLLSVEGLNVYTFAPTTVEPVIPVINLPDLVPEYHAEDMPSIDEFTFGERLIFRITNTGSIKVRQAIKYKLEFKGDFSGSMGFSYVYELKPWDIPIKPGETKTIISDRPLTPDEYRYAKKVRITLDVGNQVTEANESNNTKEFDFGLGEVNPSNDPNAKPDLTAGLVFKITDKPDHQNFNDSAMMTPFVKNNGFGFADIDSISMEIIIKDETGEEIYINRLKDKISSLTPGKTDSLKSSFMPLTIFQNACRIQAKVDVDNQVPESDEENNTYLREFSFCGQDPPLPDLAVGEIWVERDNRLNKYNFKCILKNIGNARAEPYNIFYKVYYQDDYSHEVRTGIRITDPLQEKTLQHGTPIGNLPEGITTIRWRIELNVDPVENHLSAFHDKIEEINYNNNVVDIELILPRE